MTKHEHSGWRVACASVAGSGHLKSATSCQDASKFCIPYDGCLVAAIADGAGSATQGEAGARIAVDIAMELLSGRSLEDELQARGRLVERLEALVELFERVHFLSSGATSCANSSM